MSFYGHFGIDFAQAQAALLVYILKYDLGNIWNQKVYFDERESVESRVLIFDDLRENFWKAYILTLRTGFTTSIMWSGITWPKSLYLTIFGRKWQFYAQIWSFRIPTLPILGLLLGVWGKLHCFIKFLIFFYIIKLGSKNLEYILWQRSTLLVVIFPKWPNMGVWSCPLWPDK